MTEREAIEKDIEANRDATLSMEGGKLSPDEQGKIL